MCKTKIILEMQLLISIKILVLKSGYRIKAIKILFLINFAEILIVTPPLSILTKIYLFFLKVKLRLLFYLKYLIEANDYKTLFYHTQLYL
jgi:hypothetical protein